MARHAAAAPAASLARSGAAISCAQSYASGSVAAARERRRPGRPRRRGTSRSARGSAARRGRRGAPRATRSSIVGLAHALERRDRTLDEPRHEPALGLDERRRPRDRCRAAAAARVAASSTARSIPRRSVSLPATRSTNDSPSTVDLQVVVRDAAAEDLDTRDVAGPGQTRSTARRRSSLAHARIRSPRGSKSGSSATTPATHSPKISTATSVPTSCSAGQVRVGDRRLDRVAVAAARHAPDELAADAHRLGAERDRSRVGEREAAQAALGLAAPRRAPRGRRSRPCRA